MIKADEKSVSKVLIVPMLEDKKEAIEIGTNLRLNDVNTEIYLSDKKIKAKMKYADKQEIPYVIVIGETEVETNTVEVKNMTTGDTVSFNYKEELNKIVEYVKK